MFRALFLITALATLTAQAAPRATDFALEGSSGQTRQLSQYAGRVVILSYADEDAAHQNDEVVQELMRRIRNAELDPKVTLLPIASIQSANYWPARSVARKIVASVSRKSGFEILVDWTGDMGTAYGFTPKQCHLVVVNGQGEIVFRYDGPLPRAEWPRLFDAIHQASSAVGAR